MTGLTAIKPEYRLEMRSLIFLAAVVTLACADGTLDAFQGCLAMAKANQDCIHQSINDTIHNSLEQLKGLDQDVQTKCFVLDSACKFPPPPTPRNHSTHTHPYHTTPAGQTFPTPSPAQGQCFNDTKAAFWGCFQKETNISAPNGFIPDGKDNRHGQPHEGGFEREFYPSHFSLYSEDNNANLREYCGRNNRSALANVETCVKDVVKTYEPALKALANPMPTACTTCDNSSPISSDCETMLDKASKALCKCQGEIPHLAKSTASCIALQEQLKNETHGSHHFSPPSYKLPFEHVDFCAHENACKELRKILPTTTKPTSG